jgi:ornithine cyclodeaminase
MRIVTLAELRSVLDAEAVLGAVRQAFIGHTHRQYVTPMPGQLLFEAPPGDCHLKYGYSKAGAVFVLKVATGFYDNEKLGLPVNNGMVLVFSRQTGAPLAILQDEGWLTSWRTAAAGTLAASLAQARKPKVLGVFGAGHQAELQTAWITKTLGIQEVRIWAREADADQAMHLAEKLSSSGLAAKTRRTSAEVLEEARLVVTATPSGAALFPAHEVRPGTHFVALGADSPGKQELDPALFGSAKLIATDDHEQCVDHGDFSHAVKAGIIPADADQSLGSLLENPSALRLTDADISIVDLTGIPAQDIEIAALFCRLLQIN